MMTEFKISSLPSEELSSQVIKTFPLLWRIANAIMAIFLALAAYVQLNDPDPVIWMTVYGIPCVLCASLSIHPQVIKNFLWKCISVSHLTACIVGAIYLSTLVSKQLDQSINPFAHEEGRELCGLTLVITWLAICQLLTVKRITDIGAVNCMYTWSALAFIAILPFVLWGIHLKTLDKDALPGHCKNLILQ